MAGPQRWRRTNAKASAKVGDGLAYQADWRIAGEDLDSAAYAWRVTREKRPSRAGVVRRMARSTRLALRLDAQVRADLVARDLELPAADEPGEDLLRRSVEIGAQQRLGAESASWVTDEHPADRHWREAGRVPHGRLREHRDRAIGFPVPVGNREPGPHRLRALDAVGAVGETLTHQPGTPLLMGQPQRWWGEQPRIEAQPGDDGRHAAHCVE